MPFGDLHSRPQERKTHGEDSYRHSKGAAAAIRDPIVEFTVPVEKWLGGLVENPVCREADIPYQKPMQTRPASMVSEALGEELGL